MRRAWIRRLWLAAVPLVGVLSGIGVGQSLGAGAAAPADTLALVVNAGDADGMGASVTVFNTRTASIVTSILKGLELSGLAISPDANTAYVTAVNVGTTHANELIPIDLQSNPPVPRTPVTIPSSCAGPTDVAITPDGHKAFVLCITGLLPYDLTTSHPTQEPMITGSALGDTTGISFSPNGEILYAVFSNSSAALTSVLQPHRQTSSRASAGGATSDVSSGIIPIKLTTKPPTVENPVSVGDAAVRMAITPNGAEGYVTDIAGSAVYPVHLTTTPITVGAPARPVAHPLGIALTPDARTAYAVNNPSKQATPIDVTRSPPTPRSPIAVGSAPVNVAVTPDGAQSYVTNQASTAVPNEGSVSVIDTATNTVTKTIQMGENANQVAVEPDQAPVARFSVTAAPASHPTKFDASASSVRFGSITSYRWAFGDGTSATTNVPTTSHTYAAPGTYDASVTETDSAGTSTTVIFTGQAMLRHGGPQASTSHHVSVPKTPPA